MLVTKERPAPENLTWTPWQALAPAVEVNPADLAEILAGGQTFRWRPAGEPATGVWEGAFGSHRARLQAGPSGRLEWSAPTGAADVTAPALARYWATDQPWAGWRDELPWRSDPVLRAALAQWPTLRVLRQPFAEAVLTFLCSTNRSLPLIARSLEALARHRGRELAPGVHALPDWPALAEAPPDELRACGLGYRAAYLSATARFLADRPGWLERCEEAPYPEARDALAQLPGIGPKVADCALLFGAGRLESFPVDTWITQAMAEWYGLAGWSAAQVGAFGRAHFGPRAGLAQQVLFAARRKRTSPAIARP